LAPGVPSEKALADAADAEAREPAGGPIRALSSMAFGREREVTKFQLRNGLSILCLEDHGAPLLSYQTWFGVGSRHEVPGKTGIAHLFEHLMFKGTRDYPHAVFDRLLERAGAQTNAATWLDWTFYYESLPAAGLELAVRLEADRMTNLVLDAEQFRSEREVVKNERALRVENDPEGAMEEALFEDLFPTHPYGRPTLGYLADLDALVLDDCLDFYRTWYSPGNATIVLVGDFQTPDALAILSRNYGSIEPVPVPLVVLPPEREVGALQTRSMTLSLAAPKVKIGWRTVPANHAMAAALDVLNEVLFANESSRVHRRLVEEMETASDVDGASEMFALDGLFLVDVTLNEGEDGGKAVDVVLEEMDRLASDGPDERELERARNHLEASFLRSLGSIGSLANQLGSYELTVGDFRKMLEFVPEVRRVSSEDVRRAAGTWLTRERACIVHGWPDN
jgi:zinc protease